MIDKFIADLRNLVDCQADIINFIDNPKLLFAALEELNSLVGMEAAKQAITQQLQFILIRRMTGDQIKDTTDAFEGHMLHTVIYGPPGVGKTRLGVILAKIWNSLGILRKPSTLSNKGGSISINQIRDNLQDLRLQLSYVNDNRGFIDRAHRHDVYTILNRLKSQVKLLEDDWEETTKLIKEFKGIPDFSEDSIIRIVSGVDLISQFIGDSAIKTRKLLNSCRGKVLFIDEAYSLYQGKSNHGVEALAELNRYMSEHPDKVIVILSGYRKEMEEGIFTIQPGLKRRCAWVFNVEGYSPDNLGKIFNSQMGVTDWQLDSAVDIKRFFHKNEKLFKAYGGDTHKLSFYCKLAHATETFDSAVAECHKGKKRKRNSDNSNPNKRRKIISPTMLTSALTLFKNNQLTEECNDLPLGMYQ